MKGFMRGLLALMLVVSLAFNGAFYYALEERKQSGEQMSAERDSYRTQAVQLEQQLLEQTAAAGGAQAQAELLSQELTQREEQIEQLNRTLGQQSEALKHLEEQVLSGQQELQQVSARVEEASGQQEQLEQAQQQNRTLREQLETLRSENAALSEQVSALQKQLEDSSYGQEDRVQAIAQLQKQLSQRAEALEKVQAAYDELLIHLTEAEENNAGAAALIQESRQREQQTQQEMEALMLEMESLRNQLTQAEENYGGAAATMSEQAQQLQTAKEELARMEEEAVQNQQLLEQQAEEIARLQSAPAQPEQESLLFTGREIGVDIQLPPGMLAAEYLGTVYFSQEEMEGSLRMLPLNEEGYTAQQALEVTLNELFGEQEYPPISELENGYRFALTDENGQAGEVCILSQEEALYYLSVRGDDPKRLQAMLDALLKAVKLRK